VRSAHGPSLAELCIARVAADAVGGLVPGAKVGGDPLRIALVAANGTHGTVAAAAWRSTVSWS
jgi:hypothetical protein